MADEGEELDWGGEEDEHYDGSHRVGEAGDTEDAVSIGGEEDDMQELVAFQSRTQLGNSGDDEEEAVAPPRTHSSVSENRIQRDSGTKSKRDKESPSDSRSDTNRSPLKHALPPKPVSVGPPPSFRGRTKPNPSPMRGNDRDHPSRRRESERVIRKEADSDGGVGRDRDRINSSGKLSAVAAAPLQQGSLPPDWEVRRPRDPTKADNVYYFNIRTEESTWERPQWPSDHYSGKARPLSPQSRGLDRRDISPLGTEVTQSRSSNDARPSRFGDSPNYRGRAPEPQPGLSRDERYYRPVEGPPRGTPRSPPRRIADRSPPYAQSQSGVHDNLSVEPAGPQARRGRPDRTPPRTYPPSRARSLERRRDVVSPAFDESLNRGRDYPRERDSINITQGAGPDRGWATKREQAHPRLGSSDDTRQKIEDIDDVKSRDDRRRQPYNGDAPHQRRLTRSRSPPPRERIAYRGRNTPPHMAREPVTNGDAPPLRSYTDRATREDKPSEPWNITLRDRRGPKTLPSDTTAPLRRAPDSEPRAPRRNWSPPRTLAEENAAKRRRVEERTADSSYTRRVRSPSPVDHLRSSYSSDIREESSRGYNYRKDRRKPESSPILDNGVKEPNDFNRRNRDIPDAPRWPARDRDVDMRPNTDVNLPLGPRMRSQGSLGDTNDHQIAPPISRQASARSTTYGQPAGPFPGRELDTRRLSDEKIRDLHQERDKNSMDVDIPAGPKRDRMNEPAYGRSGMYNDRYSEATREKEDSLPTGPRAMSGRSVVPPSPIDSGSGTNWRYPNGPPAMTSNGANEPSSGPPRNPRRSTRFDLPGSHHSDDSRHIPYDKDESSYSKPGTFGPPPVSKYPDPAVRRSPSLTGPSTTPASHFESAGSEPRGLSNANTIPVRSGKSWTVTSMASADRGREKEDASKSREGDSDRDRFNYESERPNIPPSDIKSSMSTDSFSELPGDVQRRMTFRETIPSDVNREDSDFKPNEASSRRIDSKGARRTGPRNSRFGDRVTEVRVPDVPDAPRTWTPRGEVPTGRPESRNLKGDSQVLTPSPSFAGAASGVYLHKLDDGGFSKDRSSGLPARDQSLSGDRSKPEEVSVGALNRSQGGRSNDSISRAIPQETAQYGPKPAIPRMAPNSHTDTMLPLGIEAGSPIQKQSPLDRPPVDPLAPVHPLRRSLITTPSEESIRPAPYPSDPPHSNENDGHGPRTAGIVRIRRPSSKFETNYSHEVVSAPAHYDSGRSLPRDSGDIEQDRPQPSRASSLLDRLNMNVDSSTDHSRRGPPPLRDRVAPPPRRIDEDFNDKSSYRDDFNRSLDEDNAAFGSNDDYSHARRNQGRGRGRGGFGGRPRRRGRG